MRAEAESSPVPRLRARKASGWCRFSRQEPTTGSNRSTSLTYPGQVRTQHTHSPAQTSPSCSRPHPPLPYSHQAGPLHSQLCLCAPSHLSGRHTPFHLLEAWYRRTAPPPPHLVTFQETRQNCLRSILRKAFILQQTTRFCFWSSNVRGVVKDKGSGRKPPGFKVMLSHLLAVCPSGCAFVSVGELNEPVRR